MMNNTNLNKLSNVVRNKNDKEDSVKYPKSVSGKQCIGPCYYADSTITHPITLEQIKSSANFCPVHRYTYTQNNKTHVSIIDSCLFPTTNEADQSELFEANLIMPQIQFDSKYFIKIYYDLNSLDDAINWIDTNSNAPFKTKQRVFDHAMVVYGNQLTIIDHRLINFVNALMIRKMPKLYRHIRQYVEINEKTIQLVSEKTYNDENPENEQSTLSDQDKKKIHLTTEYIKEMFLGMDNIQQFLSKFLRYYKEQLQEPNLSEVFVDLMIEYIIKKINMTTE
jgi:hypothetical protein